VLSVKNSSLKVRFLFFPCFSLQVVRRYVGFFLPKWIEQRRCESFYRSFLIQIWSCSFNAIFRVVFYSWILKTNENGYSIFSRVCKFEHFDVILFFHFFIHLFVCLFVYICLFVSLFFLFVCLSKFNFPATFCSNAHIYKINS